MSFFLQFSTDNHSVKLDLDENDLTNAIREALPFESRLSTWGDEIYFPVPVDTEPGELTTNVDVGDVAFWHQGQSLAVFFGPTPMSDDDKPVPADDVELIGSVSEGLQQLDQLEAGAEINVEVSN